ncbi:protein-protein interaction regulator family protein [Euphorbia peplus]|nr:protein-protein interaction regulator family protein [Euphorbia peplus]
MGSTATATTTSTSATEKTEAELQREIDELQRQQRQITDRLRDPRGLRRGGFSAAAGPRNFAANGARQRPFVRPADRNDAEDQPLAKRRLLSAVVKLEDGEILEDHAPAKVMEKQSGEEVEDIGIDTQNESDGKPSDRGWNRRDVSQRLGKRETDLPVAEHVPRVLPKDEDPSLVSRNKRMLGQLLGTLEKFRKEDVKLSGSEAYKQRSNALQRAEQRAREESERLRLQEREQIAEKRRRDLTLRARVAAKTEEKKLELMFLRWSEHHKKLCNFIRTKAEPPIYYLPKKPLDEDSSLLEQRKEQEFLEWKSARREELVEYQKQIAEQCVSKVENDMERWKNARKARRPSDDAANLQETMDKELDSHRLEHGPKTRKIPGGRSNEEEDEEDVEDINVGEDDMMDDVLVVDENGTRADEEAPKTEAAAAGTSTPPHNPDE